MFCFSQFRFLHFVIFQHLKSLCILNLSCNSISAGLDYASIGPEHASLRDSGRVEYTSVSDNEALATFHLLSKLEGIIPALESAHAVAHALKVAADLNCDQIVIVNLSGRGDKDVNTVQEKLKSDSRTS